MRAAPFAAAITATLLAGQFLQAGGAHAQAAPALPMGSDHPPLMPTRDVSVLYNVQPEELPQPQSVRVYFGGTGGLMRLDGPPGQDGTAQGEMILDRKAHTMTVVMNGPRIYMQIPEKEDMRSPFVLDDTMHFTRGGAGTVAGFACTNWTIVAGAGNATACVTEDGVVLSEQGVDAQGAKGSLVAKTVSYGPLAPSLFQPPAGYTRTAHPEGMGAGMAGPNGGAGGPMLSGPAASDPAAGALSGP